jgi:excisionase family DNA binding protein
MEHRSAVSKGTGMADHELFTRLEQLEQELPLWDRAACLPLLGLLERLKAQVWVQILGRPLDPADGPEPDRLLTIPEVAERLAIPTGYAYDLARRDVLPVVRFGKYVRVSQTSLTRWMGQQTTPQRRIDNGPLGFHSGIVTPPRQTRRPAKARPKPGPTQRARTRPVRSQPQPDADRSSRPKPAVVVAVNEPIPESSE